MSIEQGGTPEEYINWKRPEAAEPTQIESDFIPFKAWKEQAGSQDIVADVTEHEQQIESPTYLKPYINESLQQPLKPDFHTPQYQETLRAANEVMADKQELFVSLLDEIEGQALETQTYKSAIYPGVEFSYGKLTISPEVLQRIFKQQPLAESPRLVPEAMPSDQLIPLENDVDSPAHTQRHTHFLFGALNSWPGGDSFGMDDMAYDRFIREMPVVWNALKRGEAPPRIEIYKMGTPTGLDGQVTAEWVSDLKTDYLLAYGKIYKEFVEEHTNSDEDINEHITMQGASKGALLAGQSASMLDADRQAHMQVRMDSPAGDHGKYGAMMRSLKSVEVAYGLGREIAGHAMGSETFKEFGHTTKPFYEKLMAFKHLSEPNAEQVTLRRQAEKIELLSLVKGVKPDVEGLRTFVVRGVDDKLTRGWVDRFLTQFRYASHEGSMGETISNSGNQTHATVAGAHFYTPNNHYDRWVQLLSQGEQVMNSLPQSNENDLSMAA